MSGSRAVSAKPRRGGGEREAGTGAPHGAPAGPRRPANPRGEAAPGKGENRPSPNLVTATLLGSFNPPADLETGEVFYGPASGVLIAYPDGGELYAVPHRVSKSNKGSGGGAELRQYQREAAELGFQEADRLAAERVEQRRERSTEESARRARSRVRKIVRFYGLAHMVTLTFPGDGVRDYDCALRLFQNFMHDHGELVRLDGHYVAVPELHPRGHGWHWHILVYRRFSRSELRCLRVGWTEYLRRKGMPPSGGANYVRVHLKNHGNTSAAAGYAAKYVGKTFEGTQVGKGRRRFFASQGAVVNRIPFNADSLEQVADMARRVAHGAVVIESPAEDGRPPIVWASW